ncbi:FecR family protein [Roseibium aggregatum]|uniref:FecR domain-containing protein n=1 Tax=Roseibium aggregatum TaxID=187304 RepID=A0A939J3T9_9HYPH|nr:FecR domain-containing protein [Roseibium aggregatum]MBN9670004.1 FecR domain-containing protein [Roseibium aggregatum]
MADEAMDWFLQLRDKGNSEELHQGFRRWADSDSRHLEEYRKIERLWSSDAFGNAAASLRSEPVASESSVTRFRPRGILRRSSRNGRIAAALAAAVLIFVSYPGFLNLLLYLRSDYMTSVGELLETPLPDGSRMLLNTASAVSIDFDGGRRKVRILQGEAYFDVVHDPSRPFHVAAGYSDSEVKGTAFAVRRKADADLVVLERGRLEVTLEEDRSDASAILLPDTKLQAQRSRLGQVEPADVNALLSWRSGRLKFENETFGAILEELDRYHSGTLLLARRSVGETRISGNYQVSDLDAAVRTLADVVGLDLVHLPGGTIILY